MLFQACAQRTLIRLGRPGFRKHDEIPCRECVLEAEGFARQPFEAIAVHGAFRGSARNSQTEARDRAAAGSGENGEKAISRSGWIREHATELGCRVQTLLRCEPFPARLRNVAAAVTNG